MNERPRPPIAVALHSNVNGSGAPRVVAKGGGETAEKIIETAREHNVPLQEDAALATALSKLDILGIRGFPPPPRVPPASSTRTAGSSPTKSTSRFRRSCGSTADGLDVTTGENSGALSRRYLFS